MWQRESAKDKKYFEYVGQNNDEQNLRELFQAARTPGNSSALEGNHECIGITRERKT